MFTGICDSLTPASISFSSTQLYTIITSSNGEKIFTLSLWEATEIGYIDIRGKEKGSKRAH